MKELVDEVGAQEIGRKLEVSGSAVRNWAAGRSRIQGSNLERVLVLLNGAVPSPIAAKQPRATKPNGRAEDALAGAQLILQAIEQIPAAQRVPVLKVVLAMIAGNS